MNKKFTQSNAFDIISGTFGKNVIVLGSQFSDGKITIFWIYDNESELDYKAYSVEVTQ